MYKERLKQLREENNITQNDISNIIGISRGSYSHYEIENDIIPLKYLNTICNYLNVSIDYIFSLNDINRYQTSNSEINLTKCGMKIKEFRKNHKLTQTELAKILNTTQSTIADYEHGRHLIGTSYLYIICKKYHISADYLLGKIDCIPQK